jgi:membrane protein
VLAGTAAWIAIVLRMSRDETSDPSTGGSARLTPALPEHGRGRLAATPAAIGASGWRDILRRTYSEAMEDRLPTAAAGVTFFGLLALFPAITALVSVYGCSRTPRPRDHLFALSFMLPAGTFQIVEDQITRIVTQGSGALTFKLAVSLGIAIWGANAGMKAVIDGLNVAYEETEKRSFIALNVLSLALTLAALVVVLLAIFTVTIAPAVIAALRMSDTATTVFVVLRWLVMTMR